MEERQELVMYWYQAHEKTVPEAYKNKLNALLNKLTGKKQEHAFIRISVPIGKSGPEEAGNVGKNFIAAFYPVFLTYVNSTP
jgi:EpsI family protein